MVLYVIRKIINRKWLNLCLLTGIILFTAVFVCHPVFEKGAENKILQQLFANYAKENNRYPATVSYVSSSETGFRSLQEVYDTMDTMDREWQKRVDAGIVSSMQYVSLPSKNGNSSLGGRNWMLSVGNLRNMKEHIQIVKSMDAEPDQGVFPCLISESTMDAYGISAGEVITYSHVTDKEGNPVRFVVQGIFAMASETGHYWYKTPAEFEHVLFVEPDHFDALLSGYGFTALSFESHTLLDHNRITWRNAAKYRRYAENCKDQDSSFSSDLISLLRQYEDEKQNASFILWVLELPCLVLLLLFIYMVSGQIFNTEENEIAVLRSRGVTRGQILRVYLLQAGILAAFGVVCALPAGLFLCRAVAGTDGFLSFASKDMSLYRINEQVFFYMAAAGLVIVFFMTAPVWKRSDITVVRQKKRKALKEKKPVWEKVFLDVILLILSVYLLYNFKKQSVSWDAGILTGHRDPLIFLNASLFAFACALILIRLTKYLMRLIWRMGQKRWNPAFYASFLEIIRTFSQRSFLAVFLIMTVANGIFDANMARTINQNGEERLRYDTGCDVRLQERWEEVWYFKNQEEKRYYEEPDFGIYTDLVGKGLCESVTKVLQDDQAAVWASGKKQQCQLMAVNTKEFGQTAELLDGINEKHWFYALNELAGKADGAIISRNMAQKLGLSVGDEIFYATGQSSGKEGEEDSHRASAQVCAVIDGFPGYDRYGQDQERFLLVTNYAEVTSQFEQTPYQVWLRLKKGIGPKQVRDHLEEHNIRLESWQSLQQELEEREASPLIQITNGLFTMNFLISLFICSGGFLIYWIMSIRGREQLFGIYRAMGMTRRELAVMLLNEQFFGSVVPVLSGTAAGLLITRLFTGLTALIYLPEKHTIAIRIYQYGSDMVKLFAVLGMVMLVCLSALWGIMKKIKIAQALRMGEED